MTRRGDTILLRRGQQSMKSLTAHLGEDERSVRMSTGRDSGPIHPNVTRRHQYRYFFYDKHHGLDRNAACWNPELTREEEFGVFDAADWNEVLGDEGDLYG